MKTFFCLITFFSVIPFFGEDPQNSLLNKIRATGHAGFSVKGSKTIYIDPFRLSGKDKADAILITHSHYDHLSMDDIRKVYTDTTVIYAPKEAMPKLKGLRAVAVSYNQPFTVGEFTITPVPAYNISASYHPKSAEMNGYLINDGTATLYIAGDTDRIPEMKEIKAEIAIVPVSGLPYVMSAEEAAEAVKDVGATIAIPAHYGVIAGSIKDAERFKALLDSQVQVVILAPRQQ